MGKIMSLYMVYCIDCGVNGVEFYWAESEEEAKKMFMIRQKHTDDDRFLQFLGEGELDEQEVVAERVWASNSQLAYKGYVTEEV